MANLKKISSNKGITLIALVITIIIMMVLVAVSVQILVESDLIGATEKTADKYKTAYEEENDAMNSIKVGDKTLNEYIEAIKPLPEIKTGERATTNTWYTDNNGDKAMIPAGFTVSAIKNKTADETTIEGGLVIYDIPQKDLDDGTVDWENPETVKPVYNQFVWIPVEVNKTVEPVDTTTSIASFYRSEWTNSTDGGARTTGLSTSYTEPYSYNDNDYDGASGTGIKAQIEKLTESIYNNGGFYIGRYEAGVDGNTERTSSSSQTESFVVQQDKYPYNYIKWGTAMDNVSSEGAVYLSNNLYSSTNTKYGATSMLCTGACWDAMLDFVKDSNHNVTSSTNWGNYCYSETYKVYRGSYATFSDETLGSFTTSNTTAGTDVTESEYILLTTGATDRNSSKNIYDVAGNCHEWTTEAGESASRTMRGGFCTADEPATARISSMPTDSFGSMTWGYIGDYRSFRPVLYVK